MKEKKPKNIPAIMVFCGCVLCSSYYFYAMSVLDNEPQVVSVKPPDDYIRIFLEKYRNKLNHHWTHEIKGHTQIAIFDFNEVYELNIFKLPVSVNAPAKLSEMMTVKLERSEKEDGVPYWILNQNNFALEQRDEKQQEVSNILLKFNGSNFKTIVQNDSLAGYSGNFKDFSLQYSLNGICETFAQKGDLEFSTSPNADPVNLLFYRKEDFIYFVILSLKDSEGKLENNMLYSLIAQ